MKGALASFLALLLGAVSAAPSERAGIWLDVPFVHQEKEGCGAAALAMLLQYWSGKNAAVPAERSDPAKIQRLLYSREARGIYASAMEKYLRESGFQVFTIRGEWSDLEQHLSQGRPLIISMKPRAHAPLHYVVVAGIDRKDAAVLVNDPARGKLLRIERRDFEKEWRATDYWTLLAVPKRSE